jgi:preprotein translocase subunit SecE
VARLQKKKRAIDKKTTSANNTESLDSEKKGLGASSPGRALGVSAIAKKKSPSPRKPAIKPKSGMAQKDSMFHKSMQFLREVQLELKKVVWPSRKQTINSTVVVIIFSMICSFFLGFVDICLSFMLKLIL